MGRVREQGVKEEGWLLNRYLFRLKRKDTTISDEAIETQWLHSILMSPIL